MSEAVEESLESVAVIGLAGRFPGARSVGEFWRNLRNGVESIRQFFSWLSGTVLFNPELYFLSQLPAEIDLRETVSVVQRPRA